MKTKRTPAENIDEYIAQFPEEVQQILQRVRGTIRKAAPEAEEIISYQMPAYRLQGNLVYFAAFKNHIGLYPPAKGDAKLQKELAPYAGPKGNLQFPFNKPVPYGLITKVVKVRMKENAERAKAKLRKPAGKLAKSKTLKREVARK
jgi:uncharacterized protein YdhG (YjbR/CyaY superfamily)